MPGETKKGSRQPRDASTLTPEEIRKELERGTAAAERERTAALGALRTAQAGKVRVLERELARRERKGQAKAPATLALRQRLDHLRMRSAVFEYRRARACREWPEPMEDTWTLHGFVLRADGASEIGGVVVLHMADGRAIPGAEAKIEDDGYYRITIRRDTRVEAGPPPKSHMAGEKNLPDLERRNVLDLRDIVAGPPMTPPIGGPPEKPEPGKPDHPEPGKPEEPGPGKPKEPGPSQPKEPEPRPRPDPDGSVRVSVRQGDDTIYMHPQAMTPRPNVVDFLDIVLPAGGKRDERSPDC